MKVRLLAELVQENKKEKNVVHELGFAKQLGTDSETTDFQGYEGALVPGVTLLSWTIPLVLNFYTDIWLTNGFLDLSFRKPVYADEPIEISLEMEAINRPGNVISGRVTLEGGQELLEKLLPYPELPPTTLSLEQAQLATRPPLSTAVCQPGQLFRPLHTFLSPERALRYARLFARDPADRWASQAHPGWLAGQMNELLEANFSHYPAIHARSRLKLLAPALTNQTLLFTARVQAMQQRRGRDWLVFDCTVYSASHQVLAQIEHTTIYRIQSPPSPAPAPAAKL